MTFGCKTCRLLVKTGGHRGRKAKRSCVKRIFIYVPADEFEPVQDCKHWQERKKAQ